MTQLELELESAEVIQNTDVFPTEVILAILIAGVCDPEYGKQFGARCMRLASWIQPWIAPALYHTVDLWTESQAMSFLDTITSENDKNQCQLPLSRFVFSLDIATTAFSAEDHEVGRFTPLGATSSTVLSIISALCEDDEFISTSAGRLGGRSCAHSLRELRIPMVTLATRRYYNPSEPRLQLPRSITLTGVDGLAWNVYDWRQVTHLRLTCYNPTFMETRWMTTLPSLTHFAFAFYSELPVGLRILETMSLAPQIKCIVPVVFPSPMGQGSPSRRAASVAATRRELKKLDEPKIVVWNDTPSSRAIFDDVHADTFWKLADERVEAQKIEKRLELGLGDIDVAYPSYESARHDLFTIAVL